MARIPTKLLAAAAGALAAGPALQRLRRRGGAGSGPASPGPSGPSGPASAAPPSPEPPPVTAADATPPPEVPGPSVTPPQAPMSETEREERADELMPEHLPGEPASAGETLVDDEAAAAAAEAAQIGGPAPEDTADPAMRPVYEAGGGEQEGFEAAEADLIENATHGDGGGDPIRDAFPAEAEADASTARHGEGDEIEPTEVVDDTGSAKDG